MSTRICTRHICTQTGAWDSVAVSHQRDSELYQDFGVNWENGWAREVTVIEVWTVLKFFLIFLTVKYFIPF